MWLTHVLICRVLRQPNTHTVESGRSKVYILIVALRAGLSVDGPGWNLINTFSVR